MHRSTPWILILILALGLFIARESGKGRFDTIDAFFRDWVAANSGITQKPAQVTMVEINDSTLDIHNFWTGSPMDYAQFLRAILPFKPAVVGIDSVLEWPKKQVEPERILEDYALRVPKLLLAAEFNSNYDPEKPPKEVIGLRNVSGDWNEIPEYSDIGRQPVEELRLVSRQGFTNLPDDRQPITRQVPLVFRYRGQVTPSYVLQALMLWYGLTPDEVEVRCNSEIRLGDKVRIPIDSRGNLEVNFQTAGRFNRIGFDELLLAARAQAENAEIPKQLSSLDNQIVLLGRTDHAVRTLRFPTDRLGSPSELAAAAIATVQQQAWSAPVPPAFNYATVAVMMGFYLVFIQWRKRNVLLFTVVFLACYALAAISVFHLSQRMLPILLPMSLLFWVIYFRLFLSGAFWSLTINPLERMRRQKPQLLLDRREEGEVFHAADRMHAR